MKGTYTKVIEEQIAKVFYGVTNTAQVYIKINMNEITIMIEINIDPIHCIQT
jgi:hypothetical protein